MACRTFFARSLVAAMTVALVGSLASGASAQMFPVDGVNRPTDSPVYQPPLLPPAVYEPGQTIVNADEPSLRSFPTAELRLFAQATVYRAVSRGYLNQLRSELSTALAVSRDQFESTEEYRAARVEVKDAWAALGSARALVMDDLLRDDQYAGLLETMGQLDARIQFERNQGQWADMDRIQALASARLGFAEQATAMREAVFAADADVANATERFRAAQRAVDDMESAYAYQIRTDQQLTALRGALAQARIAATGAEVWASELADVRRLALIAAAEQIEVDRLIARRQFVDPFGYYYGGRFGFNQRPFRLFDSDFVLTGTR